MARILCKGVKNVGENNSSSEKSPLQYSQYLEDYRIGQIIIISCLLFLFVVQPYLQPLANTALHLKNTVSNRTFMIEFNNFESLSFLFAKHCHYPLILSDGMNTETQLSDHLWSFFLFFLCVDVQRSASSYCGCRTTLVLTLNRDHKGKPNVKTISVYLGIS